jgi:drug/metabolite transporter (DMT)-like permease
LRKAWFMTSRDERLAAMAAALTGVQVGAAMVATRFVVEQTTPGALAMMRYVIGFLCLLPVVLMGPRPRFARADVLPIAALGIAQFGVLIALLNIGLKLIPAGRASLIFALFPLLTMVLAAATGREAMTLRKTIGVLLTIAGVGFALGYQALGQGGDDGQWLGAACVFLSALCGAVCSLLYRPYLLRYPIVPVSAFAMLASVLFLAVMAAFEGFFNAMPIISPTGWLAIGFIGLSSGVGYFLWLWALGHTSATNATVFQGLSPVTAALLGVFLLGEPVSMGLLAGITCLLVGLWIALRAPVGGQGSR